MFPNNPIIQRILFVTIFTTVLLSTLGCWPLYNYNVSQYPRIALVDAYDAPVPDSQTVKVISFNIKHSKYLNQAIRLIKKEEETFDADVLLLQEMTPEAVKKIAQSLTMNYVYYPAILHPFLRNDFGNAIVSKWPIIADEKIVLPSVDPKTRQRNAVMATVQIGETPITFISLHMAIFIKPDERQDLVDIILKPLADRGEYTVVGGDFNTFTKKQRKGIYKAFRKYGYFHASKDVGWTYQQWYFFKRKSMLDHIFIKGLEMKGAGRVIDRSVSDHLPIWMEFVLPANQSKG